MRWSSVACLLVLAVVAASAVVAEEEVDMDMAVSSPVESSFVESSADAVSASEAERKKKAAPKPKKKKPAKRVYVGGDVKFNRAMNVRGVMAAGSLIANNATVKGTLIARQIKTKHIKSHTMSVGELKTTRLSSPTGTIVIAGDLLITHTSQKAHKNATKSAKGKKGAAATAAKHAAKGVSFLAEEVIVGGVKQWALVRHDTFQTDSDGWSLVHSGEAVKTSMCVGNSDRFLGGHCQLANGPVQKSFTHLPPHTQLRVTARYHFIDNWRGETAFATVNGAYVWTQSHRLQSAASGIHLCGSELYPETRLSAPIDMSLPHTASSVNIAFGSHSASSDAVRSIADEAQNACDRSFGVDDVAIWIR